MSKSETVLIVDAETGFLAFVQQILEEASFLVHTARNAQEALSIFASQPVDVLITELRLPDRDGFDLIQRARALQPESAVLVMTGPETVEAIMRAVRLDVEGFLFKPDEIDATLVEIVRHALVARRKKYPVIALDTLPALLEGIHLSLPSISITQIRAKIIQSLLTVFQATHAGLYQAGRAGANIQLVASASSVPAAADSFWQIPPLARVMTEPASVRLTFAKPGSMEASTLDRLAWSSAVLVSVFQKESHFVFLIGRDRSSSPFRKDHLTLLGLFAQEAMGMLENARLWRRLVDVAQKMEPTGDILTSAARMAALDELLPATLAEINNPLKSLKSNLYLASRRDISPERAAGGLDLAQKELYRLEGNLQRLSALARPAAGERAALDIEGLAGHIIGAFQPLFREQSVQARVTAERPLPAVLVERGALEQALMHILLNAVEALVDNPGEKIIYIDLKNVSDGVVLAIEDTGAGIAPGVEAHIFKPFFTTRPEHTGIGLTISRQLLAGMGAVVNLAHPVNGAGARFEIQLPVAISGSGPSG